jgi:hypothetical protein
MRARLPPPRPPPSHTRAGWKVSATKTPTSLAPSQDCLSRCMSRCSRLRAGSPTHAPRHTHGHLPVRSLFRVWIWVWVWVHTSPRTLLHALPFFSPHSFHTISLFPAFTTSELGLFTSVWWSHWVGVSSIFAVGATLLIGKRCPNLYV